VFNALPLKYFITPVLHLTIGKGNNVLGNYVAELQATAEGYTDKYYAAEKAEVQTKIAQLQAKDELAQFNMVMLEYEKDLKRQSKRNTLSDANQVTVELELADIVEERTRLLDAVPSTKNVHSEARKQFIEERKKPENGKAFGQSINAKMDEVLKKNGIHQAAMFGGTIEGNGARKLMVKANAIIKEMKEHVLQSLTRFVGTDEQICDVGKTHRNLLHCLDGFFLSLRTKRFHLTPAILEKGKEFCSRILAHEQYLGMSVTTKSHLMEDHAVEQQQELDGFSDLGKDFGERNHQDQAKAN
jgi:hypothetical protein